MESYAPWTLFGQRQVRRTLFRAVRAERERIDNSSHIGGEVIAIGGAYGGLQRDQAPVDEIECGKRAPTIFRRIDGELAAVQTIDAAKRVHQQLLLIREE